MYTLDDYDFSMPEGLIAQHPVTRRDQARLMLLHRTRGDIRHRHFYELSDLLSADDLLVLNNTRVVPARLFGRKQTGGKVEVLILDYAGGRQAQQTPGDFISECLLKASKRPRPGTRIHFSDHLSAEILESHAEIHTLRFSSRGDFHALLERTGEMPLPPYIRRPSTPGAAAGDRRRYQTVYAKQAGAVAAPTAGLHFSETLLAQLQARGVKRVELTLHVGYGTFLPVRVDDIRQHRMHAERFSISPQTADRINRHRRQGGRIIAVGTTCVRSLEFAADEDGFIKAGSGRNDLFIYPGYRFRIVDGMITNFHLPKSTLLMLVAAFAGKASILTAYRKAVAEQYRFFSYGDAMLIHPDIRNREPYAEV
ncbi:MAG: tRNA preQ1(34) S-adenosylmethionine ribosyltransferase-isomerase QueA [Desulfosarcina sp.]|nr:tRNA preQ1(34) S-adenosylmethionine ribosyltransferase-isomerase QueA [Desulfobacterales bacterium]